MLRVTVDPIRSEKNLQIAEQMSDDEQNQDDSRDRDDHFFSDRRAIKICQNIHAKNILHYGDHVCLGTP